MNTDLRKKSKKSFFLLNLSQQKEEENIWCQNQIVLLQSFSQEIY